MEQKRSENLQAVFTALDNRDYKTAANYFMQIKKSEVIQPEDFKIIEGHKKGLIDAVIQQAKEVPAKSSLEAINKALDGEDYHFNFLVRSATGLGIKRQMYSLFYGTNKTTPTAIKDLEDARDTLKTTLSK